MFIEQQSYAAIFFEEQVWLLKYYKQKLNLKVVIPKWFMTLVAIVIVLLLAQSFGIL